MPLYTLHMYRMDGTGISFDTVELPYDAATFTRAGALMEEHLSCDYVEVWDGERPVLARHREQPIIRPIPANAGAA